MAIVYVDDSSLQAGSQPSLIKGRIQTVWLRWGQMVAPRSCADGASRVERHICEDRAPKAPRSGCGEGVSPSHREGSVEGPVPLPSKCFDFSAKKASFSAFWDWWNLLAFRFLGQQPSRGRSPPPFAYHRGPAPGLIKWNVADGNLAISCVIYQTENFACLSNCRYCSDRAQNLLCCHFSTMYSECSIFCHKSVHFRRSYSHAWTPPKCPVK